MVASTTNAPTESWRVPIQIQARSFVRAAPSATRRSPLRQASCEVVRLVADDIAVRRHWSGLHRGGADSALTARGESASCDKTIDRRRRRCDRRPRRRKGIEIDLIGDRILRQLRYHGHKPGRTSRVALAVIVSVLGSRQCGVMVLALVVEHPGCTLIPNLFELLVGLP